MKTLPVEMETELSSEVIQIQRLLTIYGDSFTYRWTEGQSSIYYGGNWWVSKGIDFDNLLATISGQLDTLTIEVDNSDSSLSNLALSTDLRGKACEISIVLVDINQAVLGSPVIVFMGFLDKMVMDRKKVRIDIFSHMIRWKISCPRRQHSPTCPYVFKDDQTCKYDGLIYKAPTSDISAGFTKSGLSYNYQMVDDRLEDLCIGATFTASGDGGAGYEVSKAFDRTLSTHWSSASMNDPDWIKVQFGSAKIINKYKITQNNTGSGVYSPIDFEFQGSNNDSTWVTLDQRWGVNWDGIASTYKIFDFTNTTAYTYYRFYILRSHESYQSMIAELELYGSDTEVNDLDYNSTSSTSEQADVFRFPFSKVGSDVTISAVTVYLRAKQGTSSGRNLSGRIQVSGENYDASAISPALTYTDYSFVWTLNPARIWTDWVYQNFYPIDICIGGTVTESSYYSTLVGTYAFDDTPSTYWCANGVPAWLSYQFTSGKTVFCYSIQATSTYNGRAPKDFKLQGSSNGSTWYDLDTRTSIAFSASERKYFRVASPTSYTYYRLYVTANTDGNGYVQVAEMELFEYDVLNGFGYYTPANASGYAMYVSSCYMKFTTDADSCDFSPERCEELNNYPSFGGFKYIPELQTKEFWWGSKQKVWGGGL